MALIKQLTTRNLIEMALNRPNPEPEFNGKSVREQANYFAFNLRVNNYYNDPVTQSDIKTPIEVACKGRQAGQNNIIATVSVTGTKSHTASILFTKNQANENSITWAYKLCETTARNIEQIVQENARVLCGDDNLVVNLKHADGTYEIKVRDILRRINWAKKYSENGTYIGREHLKTYDVIWALHAAKQKYADILTERKLERLNILMDEYRGKIPSFKARQLQHSKKIATQPAEN